jgi:Amt family ammonium transporter
MAFAPGNAFVGNPLTYFMLNGVGGAPNPDYSGTVPQQSFMLFQMMFAIITPALISGAMAERIKFKAYVLFVVLWVTAVYLPLCHMIWGQGGYFNWAGGGKIPVLDFAGGTVVHINAGVAGLVGAFVLGKRIGFGREPMAPHSLTMTMVGASLLWFGWFGFNAGSALEANGSAAMAFMNTYLATACAVLSWMGGEWLIKGKPSMLGAASGAVAGLVAITPAAGNVGIPGAFAIGIGVGLACLWGVTGLKKLIKADDSLDVFGVHAVGGIFGALMTGIFNAPFLGGPGSTVDWVTGATGYPGVWTQFLIQLKAVCLVFAWTAVVAFIAFYVVDLVVGLRVPEEEEREGLDITSHGERAYDL